MKRLFLYILFIVAFHDGMGQGPVINSVSPVSTYPSNTVLIAGSGFNATPGNNLVWFDGVKGTVQSASTFSLQVTVPVQARVANVEVTNLVTKLSTKSLVKFIPFYSGTDFDPTKVATPLSFGQPNEVFDVCSCDLDGDGKPDLTGSIQGTATDIMILKNNSTPGNLSFASSLLASGSPMFNLACGDLNGDGLPELIATRGGATRNEVFIYRNTSTPGAISFAAFTKVLLDPGQAAFRIVVRDLNKDGKPEIIVSNSFSSAVNNVYVFINQSAGGTLTINPTPLKVPVTAASTTYGLDAQDLNGDGLPELILSQFNSNNIFIVTNNSTLSQVSFSTVQQIAVTGTLNHLTTADFNEDGKMDLAVTSAFDRKAFVLLNTGSGSTISFGTTLSLDTGDGPFGIDASDIDGDGDIDIIVGNIDLNAATPDAEVTVLRSNGNNSSLAFTTFNMNVGKKSRNVRVGDLDGDGKPDIAFTTVNGNSLDIIRNTNCYVPKIVNDSPVSICAGQTIRLLVPPGVGVSTYDLRLGGSSVSTGTNPYFDITTGGTYSVVATSESGTCFITSPDFIVGTGSGTIPAGDPATTVSSNSPVCTGNPLQLNTPTVAGVTYEWTGPNGFISSAQNPLIPAATLASAGSYSVRLASGTCKSNPVTTQVDVADLGSFTITSSVPSNTFCQGSNLTLSVNSLPGYTNQWIQDGIDMGGQNGTSLIVTQAGSYSVRLTNTLLSCSVTTSALSVKSVTVPVASFTVKATACTNETLTFTSTSVTDPLATPVFAWTFGDGGTSSLQNPTHAYATAQTYSVNLTVSYSAITGCSNGKSNSVAVVAGLQPTITPSVPSICSGDPVTLSVSGTFTSITWNTGATGAPLTLTQAGTYTANTIDANGCTGTGQVIITSKPVPAITITTDKAVVAPGQSAQLTASGADTYQWLPAETLSNPAIANPIATPLVSTTYNVTGTLLGGCSGQKSIDIAVNDDVANLKVPNVFSPNGDGINDLWVIPNIDLYPDCTLTLFNKDGIRIFEQKGYKNNWDGIYQGKEIPEGTYYFVLGCPDKIPLTGNVLLAR